LRICCEDSPQHFEWAQRDSNPRHLPCKSPEFLAITKAVRGHCTRIKDALVVELLWSTGLRVSEIARRSRDDVNLSDRFVVVRTAKTGKPRLAPLSDQACRLIRRRQPQTDGRLVGMSSNAIQQLMKRLDPPSPHAWRRGWAVHALKRGISQASVQTAAGWPSGAMVARYRSAMSAELAISEFRTD
jgi:integrase